MELDTKSHRIFHSIHVCCSRQWKAWAAQGFKRSVSVLLPQHELQGKLASTALTTSYLFVMCWCQGEGCAPRRYGQICSSFHYAMCGYQHAKLSNFGGLLFLDCKWSVLSVMEWPKPIETIIGEEKKLHEVKFNPMVKGHTPSVVVYKPPKISPPPSPRYTK